MKYRQRKEQRDANYIVECIDGRMKRDGESDRDTEEMQERKRE